MCRLKWSSIFCSNTCGSIASKIWFEKTPRKIPTSSQIWLFGHINLFSLCVSHPAATFKSWEWHWRDDCVKTLENLLAVDTGKSWADFRVCPRPHKKFGQTPYFLLHERGCLNLVMRIFRRVRSLTVDHWCSTCRFRECLDVMYLGSLWNTEKYTIWLDLHFLISWNLGISRRSSRPIFAKRPVGF